MGTVFNYGQYEVDIDVERTRLGEVVGLRWDDIDFENNEISVNHTLMCYDIGKGNLSLILL